MADIFVSYTSADQDWAFWIGYELSALGHVPHLHDWEISGGGDIAAWMEKTHDDADHILCVISRAYLDAPYSIWERRAAQWAAANDRPGFALPVLIEPCKVPSLLAPIKRCDLYGVDEEQARARLARFLAPAGKPAERPRFPAAAPPFPRRPVPQDRDHQGGGDATAAARSSDHISDDEEINILERHRLRENGDVVGASPALPAIIERCLGPGVVAVLGALMTKATTDLEGVLSVPVAHLLATVIGFGTLGSIIMCWRYVGVLGASGAPASSLERKAYNTLRKSVTDGGMPAKLYARWLRAGLDAVDRFFGDVGMADRTLFPRAFGLRTPAPLWTAPAFDRCLLLACIYPIVTIVAIWTISGHAGKAEAALGLGHHLSAWMRCAVSAGLALLLVYVWRIGRAFDPAVAWRRRIRHSIIAAFAFIFTGAFIFAGTAFIDPVLGVFPDAASVAVFIAIAIVIVFAGPFAGVCAVAATITSAVAFVLSYFHASSVSGIFDSIVPDPFAAVLGFAALFAIAGGIASGIAGASAVVVAVASNISNNRGYYGTFLLSYVSMMIAACLIEAPFLWHSWPDVADLVLIVGLLTLLNAPFDWISLGLTRALLRRGLEASGWWPFALAIVDAFLAGSIVALLALAMIIGVQAFDDLADRDSSFGPLPIGPLFDGIASHPEAPEYWWVYALLLSTMIPSLLNLMIGGASLMRGLPGLPSLMLRKMPAAKAVPTFDRAWIAVVLTLQLVLGAVVGILAQAGLAVLMLGYIMPWFGFELLHLARAVAALDLPARIGAVVAGAL
jgi:hypothetical protein